MSNPKFLHKRIKSFGFAIQGIVTFFKTQTNAWIHLVAAVLICGMGYTYKISREEWCWIVAAIAFVFVTEMMNTAIEFLTDLASPSVHPLAKKVKDVAAGAVLIAAITSFIIALVIFIPKITGVN